MIKGISVAYIHTPNKQLADWYEKTLGFKKSYGDESWQAFETSQDSSKFALDFISYPSSTVQKQSIMISFAVDDIHAAVEELAKKGVRFYPDNDKSKTIFDVGPSLVATFEDPDGNFMQISQQKKW
jgi:predicted enzyme related to lactoylglutathione lyase